MVADVAVVVDEQYDKGIAQLLERPARIGHADTLTAGHDGSALIAAADAAMYEVKKTRDHSRHS